MHGIKNFFSLDADGDLHLLPQLLQQFPQVGRFVPDEIRSFLLDAKPYVGDRLRLRHELRDRWLGTYVYYYYTENNDPDQVMKPNSTQQSGVN